MIRNAFKFTGVLALTLCASAQTLRLSCASTTPTPGSQELCSVFLDGASLASMQFTLSGSSLAAMTGLTGRPGPSASAGTKSVTCSALPAASVTCAVAGANTGLIQPAISSNFWSFSAVDLVLTWGATAPPSSLVLGSPIGANADGSAAAMTVPGNFSNVKFNGGDPATPPVVPPITPPPTPTNNCDLNRDGKIDQADVFIAIGNLLTGAKDLSFLGKVVSAANGGACGL